MKSRILTQRPGFEFIFAAGIAAIFIVPSVVMGQTKKNTEIIITNGDTVINGKNIKTLSASERADALKDMNRLRGDRMRGDFVIRQRGDYAMQEPVRSEDGVLKLQPGDYRGSREVTRVRLKRMPGDSARVYTFKYETNGEGPEPPMPPARPDADRDILRFRTFGRRGEVDRLPREGRVRTISRRNSQRFSYSNTDGAGITTDINYSINEPMDVEKGSLVLTDIKLVPDFTTGKTTLSFGLPTRSSAEVELTNTDGKTVWNDRVTGNSFSRSFAMPLNGMYHLKVRQGGKTAMKDIMKEQ